MNAESITDKYLKQTPKRDDGLNAAESYVAMLDLQLPSGNRVAYPYATLLKAEFNPSEGIVLHFSTDEVRITGYRLEPIYRSISQHRLPRLESNGSRGDFGDRDAEPVVTDIRVQSMV